MLLTTLLLATAEARPVESSEFRHTGATLDKGTWSMRALMPAGYGITDRVEAKVMSPVGFAFTRDIFMGVEVALVDTAAHDLSLTGMGRYSLDNEFVGYEASASYTFTSGRSALSFTPLVEGGWGEDDYSYTWVNLIGFYDFRVNEQHGLRVRLTQRPQTWGTGVPAGSAAIAWVGGSGTVRAQIGLGVAYGQALIEASEFAEWFGIHIPKVMPYPDVALWWTF